MGKEVAAQAAAVALAVVLFVGYGVVGAVGHGVVVFAVGGFVPAFVVGEVVAAAGIEVHGESFISPGVGEPWRDGGL